MLTCPVNGIFMQWPPTLLTLLQDEKCNTGEAACHSPREVGSKQNSFNLSKLSEKGVTDSGKSRGTGQEVNYCSGEDNAKTSITNPKP